MKKGRIIATSIASIAMCASLIAGGTYALFTSESTVNVAVTSGKVDVSATVDGASLRTYSALDGFTDYAKEDNGVYTSTWSNGGFASVDGANVTLDRITPTDGANFDIDIKNESNVAIQYKVSLIAEESKENENAKLMDALLVKITGKDGNEKIMNGNELLWSNWTFVQAGNQFEDTVNVDISMPNAENNNDYQDLGVTITCRVDAVQGNATMTTPDENTALAIYNAEEFVAFAESVNGGATYAGKTVELMKGFSLADIDWRPIGTSADSSAKFKGTFEGNHNVISDLTVDTSDENAYQATGLFGALNGTLKNLTVKNATIKGFTSGSATDNGIAVVAGSIYTQGLIENVHVTTSTVEGNRYVGGISGYTYGTVKDCSVSNTTITAIPNAVGNGFDNGDKVGGIVGAFWDENKFEVKNNKVNNVTIKGYRDLGGVAGAATAESVVNNNVSNITILVDQGTNYYGDKAFNAGFVVGRELSGKADKNTVSGKNEIRFVVQENAHESWLTKAMKADVQTVVIDLYTDATVQVGANTQSYYFGGANTQEIVVNGNGNTLTFEHKNGDWNYIRANNDNCKFVLNDLYLTNAGRNNGPWNRHDIRFYNEVEMNNIVSNKAIALLNNATLNKVAITEDIEAYGLWIVSNGQTVDINGLEIEALNKGRGIKIADEYVDAPSAVTLNIANATFKTAKKAAILVTVPAGAKINVGENVDFSQTVDTVNVAWADKKYSNANKIIVKSGTAINEADDWNGTADISWFLKNPSATEFTIDSAEALAGLAELVDGKAALPANNDIPADWDGSFDGVTFKLASDIDLFIMGANNEPVSFDPIGDEKPFKGTFDGQGHTIRNMYQSGWAFGYEWGIYGSLGLFGEIQDATIKNLTISGAESYVEGGDVGGITGSASGTCVFENIILEDSTFATYNNGNGGIIGWSGAGNYTFKNITLKEDVVLAGLWGSFDSSIGGVVGQAEPGATYNFQNVDIACRLDVYNDCTASYDYYNYRMCGMIIGRLAKTTTIDGVKYPDTTQYNITCEKVTVTYEDWANYHYCEPTPSDMNGGRGMRVESGYQYGGLPADYDHSQCVANHMNLIPFDQIFGGDQIAVKGLKTYDGVTVVYNN